MGITNFSTLLKKCPNALKQYPLSFLNGKRVAIDAMWWGYTYWSVAYRNEADKTNILTNEVDKDQVFERFINLIKLQLNRLFFNNILPVFVMDGSPSKVKYEYTVDKRKKDKKTRNETIKELRKKIDEEGVLKSKETVEKYKKAVKSNIGFTYEYSLKYVNFIQELGIPYLKAQGLTGEADKLCVYLLQKGYVQGIFSNDRDFLIFGAKYLITGYTGVKYNKYTDENIHHVSIIDLNTILTELDITYYQLVDIAILAGCDYNQKLPGKGIVAIYNIIKKRGSIEGLLDEFKEKLRKIKKSKERHIIKSILENIETVETIKKKEETQVFLDKFKEILLKFDPSKEIDTIKGFLTTFEANLKIINYSVAREMFLSKESYSDLCVKPDYKLEINVDVLKNIDTVLEKYNISNWSSRIKGFYARFLETKIIVTKTNKGIMRLKVRNKNPYLDTQEDNNVNNVVKEITIDMKSFFLS